MRALLLLESLVVVGLAVGILLGGPGKPLQEEVFRVDRLLLDAKPGEEAEYRSDDGLLLSYRVQSAKAGGGPLGGTPEVFLETEQRDATGIVAGGQVGYAHDVARHGIFPLLTPAHPDADDRLWVWRRIRREAIPWQGRTLLAWRVDAIDPALPPDDDTVVVHFHEDAPVFGIVRWSRHGRTFDLVSPWKAP